MNRRFTLAGCRSARERAAACDCRRDDDERRAAGGGPAAAARPRGSADVGSGSARWRQAVRQKRRGGDSNPRWNLRPITVFETAAFNHSATSPCRTSYRPAANGRSGRAAPLVGGVEGVDRGALLRRRLVELRDRLLQRGL